MSISKEPQGQSVLTTLKNKMQCLRNELDSVTEELSKKEVALKNEIHLRVQAEAEVQALTRRIRLIEEDLEQTNGRLSEATGKLEQASKRAEETERSRKVMENRLGTVEDEAARLELKLKDTSAAAAEAEKKYEEISRKQKLTESQLERAEDRAEAAERKAKESQEELQRLSHSLRSLELSEAKSVTREESYEVQMKDLTLRLKEAADRAEVLEREATRRQKELDKAEEKLVEEKKRCAALKQEMDTMLAEFQQL